MTARLAPPAAPVLTPADGRVVKTRRMAWSVQTAAAMAAFAELAYSEARAIELAIRPAGFALAGVAEADGLLAFLAVSSAGVAVLSFRGTANLDDWSFNLDADRVPWPGRRDIGVHGGFWRAWLALESQVRAAVEAHVPAADGLFVSGHSLGGALAQIAAVELERPNLSAVYTFGSPRVATAGFDAELAAPHYRVVDRWDLVPAVPAASPWGYLHSGDARLLDDAWPDAVLRRDRDLIARAVVNAWSLAVWPVTRRIFSIDDHMIWNYRARLEAIARTSGG